MTTCIHSTTGLCPDCQAIHDEDPEAWAEYGYHPEGQRRWAALENELAQRVTAEPAEDDLPL